MSEKLQKVLATAGLGSRRQIEEWIKQERISINGQIATIGARVTLQDKIRVDGRVIKLEFSQASKTRMLIYHKPEGEICSRTDPEGRPTVFEKLPKLRNGRWIAVGRLDINTSGLLLFTSNGELAHRLMHPSFEFEREYAARIHGQVTTDILKTLKQGVELDGELARFESIEDAGGEGSNHWYHVIVKEGRRRLVRQLWESQEGLTVSRLIRVRFGNIALPKLLKRGYWQELETEVIAKLTSAVNISTTNKDRHDSFTRKSKSKSSSPISATKKIHKNKKKSF